MTGEKDNREDKETTIPMALETTTGGKRLPQVDTTGVVVRNRLSNDGTYGLLS